jgi:glutamine synthetase
MTFRFSALRDVIQRQPLPINVSSGRISDYYGQNVFSTKVMREYLTDEAYASVMSAAGQGQPIDRRVADQVASSMKDWALSKGATHYTHWFQPLTGSTAANRRWKSN